MELENNKINWLSILQGWGMLLVVLGHVVLSNEFKNPDYPVTAATENIIYGFHMPLFMFISGLLFFFTKIKKQKPYKAVVADKLKRLGIPYIFFTALTLILKYAFNPLMKRPVELSLKQVVDSFIYPSSNPLGELWFIATLLFIFLLYPVFVYSLKSNTRIIITLLIFIVSNIYFTLNIALFCISHVVYMLVFFYCGILFIKKNCFEIFKKWYVFILLSLLFTLVNVIETPGLLKALVGISFSITLCINLSKIMPTLFSSFRNYTFQIFLMGIFFQMGIRFLYIKFSMPDLYSPLYITSVLLALYIPVFVGKLIQKTNNKYLYRCFGL